MPGNQERPDPPAALEEAVERLRRDGVNVNSEMRRCFETHKALIREWNPFASLVSSGDIAELDTRHLVDSLSLVPSVLAACRNGGTVPQASRPDGTVAQASRVHSTLLDIGSGGGFPAVPIKAVLPELELVMVERSSRRVAFLRKVTAASNLAGVRIVNGNFPENLDIDIDTGICAITARAVEKPGELARRLVPFLEAGAVYICQSESAKQALESAAFHVEHVRDQWVPRGLRRGELYLISAVDARRT